MKSVNFLDLETVVVHAGRAPFEGEVTGRRWQATSVYTVLALPASPKPNPSSHVQSPHLFHGVHQSLHTNKY